MQRALVVLALVLSTACAGSGRREPTAAELEVICQERRCRPPTSLALPVDETHVYAVDFPASPWVAGPGLISLLPGETITITGTVGDGGDLRDLEVVDNTPEPTPDTIVLHFFAPELGSAMMRISNNFDARLTYDMAMFVPMKDGLFSTSSVPVLPGTSTFELWPHPIIQLVLTGFRLERGD